MRRAHPSETRRVLLAGFAVGGVLATASLYLWAYSPHDPASVYPVCPTKLITGFDCPGCGALRMGHDLLRGDLAAAAHDNLFLLLLIPVAAVWGGWYWWRYRRGERPKMPARALIVILVLAVVWGVVRNLPGFPLTPGA